jgi:hypothetical protein
MQHKNHLEICHQLRGICDGGWAGGFLQCVLPGEMVKYLSTRVQFFLVLPFLAKKWFFFGARIGRISTAPIIQLAT